MNNLLYIVIGLVAGIAGGAFGVGGATIMIPALVFLFGFSQHLAQGTTLAALVPPIGLLAAIRYWQSGNVKISVAAFICFGFFVGGYIGASLVQNLDDLFLKRLFGVFLLFISLRMIFTR
jgi:uncharacterized protein